MSSRLIAFGDIHGCAAALATLVETLQPQAEDCLVFLGDYVDRGPDSRGVINQILALRQVCQVVTLLGNHEQMMLGVLQDEAPAAWWLRYGGVQTLESYDFTGDLSAIPAEHIEFLQTCADYHVTKDFFFVHANYLADELLKNQPDEALRWQSLAERMPGPHVSGRTAIVGHTAQKSGEVLDAGHIRCIDTYCHGGGWLTAMDVIANRVWQADRAGAMRDEDS